MYFFASNHVCLLEATTLILEGEGGYPEKLIIQGWFFQQTNGPVREVVY